MATGSQDNANSQFSRDNLSADAIRARLLKDQSASAIKGALSDSLDLFSFLGTLPDAFAASQAREARRLQKFGGENNPRLKALKDSIEGTEILRNNAQAGKARADRGLAALSNPNDIFHGFVSDPNMQPLKGYTVKLTAGSSTASKVDLSAITEYDGYFCITLKTKDRTGDYTFPGQKSVNDEMVGWIQDLFGMAARTPMASTPTAPIAAASGGPAASASMNPRNAKVEGATNAATRIGVELRSPSGKPYPQDPIPGLMDGGSIYREYFLEDGVAQKITGRYVGNPNKRELHDTENLSNSCNFDSIKPEVRVYFDNTGAAIKAGYDYCAHCFGKANSKR